MLNDNTDLRAYKKKKELLFAQAFTDKISILLHCNSLKWYV